MMRSMREVCEDIEALTDRGLIPARIDANRIHCRQRPLLVMQDHAALVEAARLLGGDTAVERVQDEARAPFIRVAVCGYDLAHAGGVQ